MPKITYAKASPVPSQKKDGEDFNGSEMLRTFFNFSKRRVKSRRKTGLIYLLILLVVMVVHISLPWFFTVLALQLIGVFCQV
jgi:hypothetical protein